MSNNTIEIVKAYYTLNPQMHYFISAFIKLGLSTLMSFIISIEREMHSHPGGICTHTLVGFGSCLFTITSVHLQDKYPSSGDPARICAQIVSGMGFLGSATIIKSQNYVKGINTAANIWISAAISKAIGLDLWEFASVTALFTVLILFCNNRFKKICYGRNNNQNNTELSRDPQDAPYGDETDDNE